MAVALTKHHSGLIDLEEATLIVARQEEAERQAALPDIVGISDRQLQMQLGKARLGSLRLKLFRAFGEPAVVRGDATEWLIGRAGLRLGAVSNGPTEPIAGLDIVGWAALEIATEAGGTVVAGTSSSLIYARDTSADDFAWFEVAFRQPYLINGSASPFGLDPASYDFRHALNGSSASTIVAYGPRPVEGRHDAEFIDRWASIAAAAILARPHDQQQRTSRRQTSGRPLPLRLMAMAG